MKLTQAQRKVFNAYYNVEDGMGFHFSDLEKLTGVKRNEIRLTVRQLANFGLLEFMRGCWTEYGEMYGSAYVLTAAGRAALAKGGGE